ncbi:6478_t:CDS:1, partial [Racocetra persica]
SASNLYLSNSSSVWLYFEPPIDKDGKKKFKYSLCTTKTKYLTVNNSGTSNLCNHFINVHNKNIPALSSEDSIIVISQSGEHSLREALVE